MSERIRGPNFLERLLNTLKNERRLQLLDIIAKQRRSLAQLQMELRSQGYVHSQQTIVEEYITPMVEVGLVQEEQNPYAPTLLGSMVNDIVSDFHQLEESLPAHSECYEETVLGSLLEGAKTYEKIRDVIPTKSAPRVVSRLQKTGLLQAPKEKDYIFFYRTKRDPDLSRQVQTEKRVYDSIPEDGVSAKRLASVAGISLRRTYKYLRKLKGKKLVFVRKKPLSYSLTEKGAKLAEILKALRKLSEETQVLAEQFLLGTDQMSSGGLANDSLVKNERASNFAKMQSN